MAILRNVVGGCCIRTTILAGYDAGSVAFRFHRRNKPTGGPVNGPAESASLMRSRKFSRCRTDIFSTKKAAAASAAAGNRIHGNRNPLAICCRLRRRTGSNHGSPNVPMTAPDATERDLRQELEPPSSAPLARLREPAWARALASASARRREPQLSVPQAWQPQLAPPSLPAWPSWLIFSAPPPWTFWRISSPISLPTSLSFSPTSSQLSSLFSWRIFSSPSQAFSCSFYSFCSFFP